MRPSPRPKSSVSEPLWLADETLEQTYRSRCLGLVIRWGAALALAALLTVLPTWTTYAQVIAVPPQDLDSPGPPLPVVTPGPEPLERQPRRTIRIAPQAEPDWQRDLERLKAYAAGGTPTNAPIPSAIVLPSSRAEAAWLMGLLRLHDLHGLPDGSSPGAALVEARQWFVRAQAGGARQAEAGLAWCAIDGCGQAPSQLEAERWLQRLQTHMPGLAAYLRWQQASQAGDALDSAGLLQRAARLGDVNALIELGIEQAEAGHFGQARAGFQRAASRSAAAADNVRLMDRRLNDPAGADRSHPTAFTAGTPAQDLFAQAQRFHRGTGVPVNYVEAIRLYRLAAQAGHPAAQRMLALIFSRQQTNGQPDLAWVQQLAWLDATAAQPTVGSPVTAPQLRREPTPLFHLLPAAWRDAVLQSRQTKVR